MSMPANHPLRIELNDEAHARPPEALRAPVKISYLAMASESAAREAERAHVAVLAAAFGVRPPEPGVIHYSADFGRFRLKWERHSEFARYKFIVAGVAEDPFEAPAVRKLPEVWLAGLPGRVMVATHVALVPAPAQEPDFELLSAKWFAGNPLVGAGIAGGAAVAVTDFRIRADGFSRLLVMDRALRPRQAGRAVQRLLEIDTYRLMALLAFPVARALAPALGSAEAELAEITSAMTAVTEAGEPALLDRLTRLAAQLETAQAQNRYRLSAARAYYQLVQQKIAELREDRIPAIQTFKEFTELRLAPAMTTVSVAAGRLESLSAHVARATQMLSTRVDITREHQAIAQLEAMNRRADLQLRLQQTVEGLSVAAVTYYIVGLIGYAARGVKAAGVTINPELAMGISIPFVIGAVAFGIRRIHRMVHDERGAHE